MAWSSSAKLAPLARFGRAEKRTGIGDAIARKKLCFLRVSRADKKAIRGYVAKIFHTQESEMNKKDILSLEGLDWLIAKPILEVVRELPFAGFLPFVSKTVCKKALEQKAGFSRNLQIFMEKLCDFAQKDKKIAEFLTAASGDKHFAYALQWSCYNPSWNPDNADCRIENEKELSQALYRYFGPCGYLSDLFSGWVWWDRNFGSWQIPVAHNFQNLLRMKFLVKFSWGDWDREGNVGICFLFFQRKPETIFEIMAFAHLLSAFIQWPGKERVHLSGLNCECFFNFVLPAEMERVFRGMAAQLRGLSSFSDEYKVLHAANNDQVVALVKEELIKSGLGMLFES